PGRNERHPDQCHIQHADLAALAPLLTLYHRHRHGFGIHAHTSLPNRPLGRTSSTRIITRKITVLAASGQNTLVKPSRTPMNTPVMMAPMIEPMPPITTTANTTISRFAPIAGATE